MGYNPSKHHRRSIRLGGYDYSTENAYYVTACTQNRECLFGKIEAGEMVLNDAGRMVEQWFQELGSKFADLLCDAFVCMPNHVHFVVVNAGADLRVFPRDDSLGEHAGSPLHVVVQWFKTMKTNEYIRGVKQRGWLPFDRRLWQRNYWERIIRNDSELCHIRQYIRENPSQWECDHLHEPQDQTRACPPNSLSN